MSIVSKSTICDARQSPLSSTGVLRATSSQNDSPMRRTTGQCLWACAFLLASLTMGAKAEAQDSDPSDPPDMMNGTSHVGETAPKPAEKTDTEQYVRVGLDDRVTMHVSGLPLSDALRMLSEPSKRNIVLSSNASGTVTASLYNVTFDEALEAMLVSNGLGYRKEGNFIYVHPADELSKLAEAQRKISSRVFKLTYLNAATAKELLAPLLSTTGKIATTPPSTRGLGGETGPEDTEGDATASSDIIIVTDFEDILDNVAKVIVDLDARPQQVLIESTILRATLNEDNALGIDFTTVGGIDFSQLSSVSPAAQSITTGNIPTPQLNNTNFTVRTDLNGGLPDGGFTFGILKDQIGVFVRALEQITDTDILANPKLLALNKQVGQVIVGRRDGYLTTTITETTAIQTVEFLETGTVLTFRPFIGKDGIVRMEIHPKDSTGGLTDANLPFEQTTEVTTNILVRDGRTILIGGLFREVGTATRGQVPLLGNIPVAGALFRRTRDSTVREEVIILLTVHIIKGDADEKASEELAQDVERYRAGARQGVQWFGRERLGQAHYRWATEHLARGDVEKALWDAQLAVNAYPQHIQAIKLKEELVGKRLWEDEASTIRSFIRNRIESEAGGVTPEYGRPGPPFEMPDDIEGPVGTEETDPNAVQSEPNQKTDGQPSGESLREELP